MTTFDCPYRHCAHYLKKHGLDTFLLAHHQTLQLPPEPVRRQRKLLTLPRISLTVRFGPSSWRLYIDRLTLGDSDKVRDGSHLAKNNHECSIDSGFLLSLYYLLFESSLERRITKTSSEDTFQDLASFFARVRDRKLHGLFDKNLRSMKGDFAELCLFLSEVLIFWPLQMQLHQRM